MPPQDIALTIKLNKNDIPNDEFEPYIRIYNHYLCTIRKYHKVKIIAYVYEKDSKGKLHVHAHVQIPAKTRYTALHMGTNIYNTCTKPITNRTGWYKYMYKDPYQIGQLPVRTPTLNSPNDQYEQFILRHLNEITQRHTKNNVYVARGPLPTQRVPLP